MTIDHEAHFTTSILEEIKAGGVEVIEITLHVGYGTFEPVRVDDLGLVYCDVCDRDRPVIREPGPGGDVLCAVCKFILPIA